MKGIPCIVVATWQLYAKPHVALPSPHAMPFCIWPHSLAFLIDVCSCAGAVQCRRVNFELSREEVSQQPATMTASGPCARRAAAKAPAAADGAPPGPSPVVQAFHRFLGPMLAAALDAGGRAEAAAAKLDRMVGLWADRAIFNAEVIAALKAAMAAGNGMAQLTGALAQAAAQPPPAAQVRAC